MGPSVGVVVAVGVEVAIGDGTADKGVWAEGAGSPKGEQPSPMVATIPRIQVAIQSLLGTEDRIADPLSTDKRFFIGSKS